MPHCQTYIKSLRNLGYRITPQREMIIEALAHSSHHMTAEEIYAQVHERTRAVNIATIYRTLDLLVEQGMASRAGLQDGRVVYAASNHGSHLHLVCRAMWQRHRRQPGSAHLPGGAAQAAVRVCSRPAAPDDRRSVQPLSFLNHR